MKYFDPARRVGTAAVMSTLLLASLFAAPASATQTPVPAPTVTPVPTETPEATGSESDSTATTSVLEVSPELSLALEVVEGPVRNEADGTYSVTYELVVTQAGDGEIEPLSLLGFTTTSEVVTNEGALEQNAEVASQDESTGSASEAATATPAPTATPTPTPVPEIQVRSGLGVAKRVVADPVIVDGAFEFTYEVSIRNTGEDAIEKLRIVDDLAEVFGTDAEIEILNVAGDGQIDVNDAYDGIDDVELLAAGSSLAVGKIARLSVSVAVVPTELGIYEMNVAASGTSASGVSLLDVSTDGRSVDADDDDDPSNDSEPTTLNLANDQSLEINVRILRNAAEASADVFSGAIALEVTNPGPFDVENLQIYEAFADSTEAKLLLESATSDTLSVNPWFDGRTDIALLSGLDSLEVGASAVVVLDVLTNLADLRDVEQLASAEGTDPFGTTIKAGTDQMRAADASGEQKPEKPEPATTSSTQSEDRVPAIEPVASSAAAEDKDNAAAEDEARVAEPTQSVDQAESDSKDFEVSAAPLQPAPVSGALRLQYQVAIVGLIALVIALVGGGTAASINRRERRRARHVTDWLHTR